MRKIAAVLVLVLVLGVFAFGRMSEPVVVTCGTATGSVQATDQGISIAREAGEFVNRVRHGYYTRDRIEHIIDGAARKVVALWWRSFLLGGKGKPADPEIMRVQRKAAQQRADAARSCTPCPGADQPDQDPVQPPATEPSTPTPPPGEDPRDFVQAASFTSTLSGAPLAADALRKAGFPESEVPMGTAVAKYESSYQPTALLVYRGQRMLGMWQINEAAHRALVESGGDWRDPYANARWAYQIWLDAGRSWSPWSTAAKARAGIGDLPQLPDNPVQPIDAECVGAAAGVGQGGATGAIAPADYDKLGNPRTVEQAIAWFLSARPSGRDGEQVENRCERWMNLAYGYGGGYDTAMAHWNAPGDRTVSATAIPPRGALVFWRTSNPAGHVGMSLGNGMVISTDYNSETGRYEAGMISAGPISDIDAWGPRLGYRPPDWRQAA